MNLTQATNELIQLVKDAPVRQWDGDTSGINKIMVERKTRLLERLESFKNFIKTDSHLQLLEKMNQVYKFCWYELNLTSGTTEIFYKIGEIRDFLKLRLFKD